MTEKPSKELRKKPTIDTVVNRIEDAIFGGGIGEFGCTDTPNGDMVLTAIGRIRIKKILEDWR